MPTILGPPRKKRLLYSILSVVLGVLAISVIDSVLSALSDLRHLNVSSAVVPGLVVGMFTLPLCLIGWLLALPIVLTITNLSPWRFPILWVIGTVIGPLVILGISVVAFLTNSSAAIFSVPESLMWFAAIVASLVTLIYPLLVRYDQRRARRRQADNAEQPGPTPQTS